MPPPEVVAEWFQSSRDVFDVIQEEFEESVHHTLLGKTDKELPVCNDCHSAHTIQRVGAARFTAYLAQVIATRTGLSQPSCRSIKRSKELAGLRSQ